MNSKYIRKSLLISILFISSINVFAQTSFNSYAIISQGSNSYYYCSTNDGINEPLNNNDFGSLSSISTLILNGGELSTWNLNGAKLFYQLYIQGSSDKGDVHSILLPWSADDGGNKKWAETNASINLLSGLSDGNYVLEVWFLGTDTYNGNTGVYENNSGNNYIATFTYSVAPTSSTKGAITFEPLFPSLDDPLTITYRSNEGNQAMKDELESYVHTGLNSNWTPSSTWLNNSPKYKLTKLADNNFELIIADLRTYFGVNSSFTANEMKAIFRNSDGTKQGKDISNNDFLIPLYDTSLHVRIEAPTKTHYTVAKNETISVSAVSNSSDKIEVYIDGIKQSEKIGTYYKTEVNTGTTAGLHTVQVKAIEGASTTTDEFTFYVLGDEVIETVPVNIVDGINYIDDNTVTLAIYAPHKENIFVIGDFNNWQQNQNHRMKHDVVNNRFWVTITGLTKGQEYAFQYFIDGELRLADAYTEKILDEGNDQYIPSSVYPNLKAYPSGETSHIVSVLQTGQVPYTWQVPNFTPTEIGVLQPTLNIYELHLRDFTLDGEIGTIKEAIKKLDYLQTLGINAIELMPINEFEGNNSWGYNPSFFFATDKAYGTKGDYKLFIDECHKRGMSVIIDMVLNHSFGQSPMVRMYFDKSGSWGAPSTQNPWFNVVAPHDWSWGADFNHESQATKDFVDRVTKFWLEEFNIDGYRFDFTKGFTNNSGTGWNYDVSRVAILKHIYDEIKVVNPNAYVILEHLTAHDEEKVLMDYGMMMWSGVAVNGRFINAMKGWSNDNHFLAPTSYKNRGSDAPAYPNLVAYMESHDEERITPDAIEHGNASGDSSYDIKDLNTTLKRAEAAAVIYLSIPGPKMIWQFGELGYDVRIDEGGRTGEKPVRWNYLDVPERKNVYNVYSQMNHLREKYPAFITNDFTLWEETNNSGANAMAKSVRLRVAGQDFVVMSNFNVVPRYCNPQWEENGTWVEYFSNDTFVVNDGNRTNWIELQPGEYRVYSLGAVTTNTITWNGSTSDWNTVTNWTPNRIPTSTDEIIFPDQETSNNIQPIFNGTATYKSISIGENVSLSINQSLEIEDLYLDDNSDLIINNNTVLNVSNMISNDGTITIEEQGILYQGYGSETFENGTTIIKRASRFSNTDIIYNMWSSPVSEAILANVFTLSNENDIYTYNQQNGFISPVETSMVSAKGYVVTGDEGKKVGSITSRTFQGKLNNGDISIPVFNGTYNSEKGYNLVGNPYPSAISWNSFVTDNSNIDGSCYVLHQYLDGNGDLQGDYIVRNGSGSTSVNGHSLENEIYSTQGFFVKLKIGEATGTVEFNNSQRVLDIKSGVAKKHVDTGNKFWIDLIENNKEISQTLVALNENATGTIDNNYDAMLFGEDETKSRVYTNINSDKFAIQTLNNSSETKEIPFNVFFNPSRLNKLSINKIEGLDATYIYVIDNDSGEVFDIKNNEVELISTAQNHLIYKNYTLIISASTLNNDINSYSDFKIWSTPNSLKIYSGKKIKQISIYSINSSLVFTKNISLKNDISIETPIHSGIYIAVIKLEDGSFINRKIII